MDISSVFNNTTGSNMSSLKRSSELAGLDGCDIPSTIPKHDQCQGFDSDDSSSKDEISSNSGSRPHTPQPRYGKKTRGRVKINMEFIDNKLRRYTTFSKRKSGIMKKAHELATLTGTQVMLLVASETGHVYTFATRKLQPILSSDAGKQLIQTCLNSPDPHDVHTVHHHDDQRMSAQGFEEPELSYAPADDSKEGLLQKTYHILNAISQQQTDLPTMVKTTGQPSSSFPMNLVSFSSEQEVAPDHKMTSSAHTSSDSHFSIVSSSDSSFDSNQPHIMTSSNGIRTHTNTMSLHDSQLDMTSSHSPSLDTMTSHSPSQHQMRRDDRLLPDDAQLEERKITIVNTYNHLHHSGLQPVILASPNLVSMSSTQAASNLNDANRKLNRR